MRKIILSLHMSLDNVVSDPEKWMIMDDELLSAGIEYYNQLDIAIFGSKTYPFMVEYWTNAEFNSTSKAERDFAKLLNQKKKVILSRSSLEVNWNNAELLQFKDIASLSASLKILKEQGDKNISVESGIGLWKVFLENSLFDELIINIQPIIVGKGVRLFYDFQKNYNLTLKSSRTFSNGVVELWYSKK